MTPFLKLLIDLSFAILPLLSEATVSLLSEHVLTEFSNKTK